jgi:hypothetical protein
MKFSPEIEELQQALRVVLAWLEGPHSERARIKEEFQKRGEVLASWINDATKNEVALDKAEARIEELEQALAGETALVNTWKANAERMGWKP